MKKTIFGMLLACLSCSAHSQARDLVWADGVSPTAYTLCTKTDPVVSISLQMLDGDLREVTGQGIRPERYGLLRVYQLNRASSALAKKLAAKGFPIDRIQQKLDAFAVKVEDNTIYIIGNNGRGVAYGLLELSRLAGVSPWRWWGDVVPERRSQLALSDGYETVQAPSVDYRGIFINDEDWSLRNWASETHEKAGFGVIGPKTYKRIFELMLRLRANTLWPGMHEGTAAFFTVEGNQAVADSCAILIGSSHCEPLLRNNVGEWDVKSRGRYNFITNRDQVVDYWTERLRQVAGTEKLFTIGMRGIHDGSMEGVKTMKEKVEGLQAVIDTQRELLKKYINSKVETVPQIFIPYKEVLEIYENGLRVPDDVTLMWCDDNYGYMTRLSDEAQQRRSGGGGIYYHLSYWGRPHDYLWLTTTQPGLLYNEMREAYNHNARKVWLVNVHDPKVAAYDLSLFLDMAWNIDCVDGSSLQHHLQQWLSEQFGAAVAERLTPVMTEYYRLCAIRKPEFMGWSQVELDKKTVPRGRSQATDTEFSSKAFGNELTRYLHDYQAIAAKIDEIKTSIRPELSDAYFASIEYPVKAAFAMARKTLEAQRSRSFCMGQNDATLATRKTGAAASATASMAAYDEIQQLTRKYNEDLAGGKWRGLMDAAPRDLPVFFTPSLPVPPSSAKVAPRYEAKDYGLGTTAIARNACDYDGHEGSLRTVEMLGHSMKAVALEKGSSTTYRFETAQDGDANLTIALIPTQANDTGDIRFAVSVDGGEEQTFTLKEPFRSQTWKENVLRGQARRTFKVALKAGGHTLSVRALDAHILLDQWLLDFDLTRKAYVIPTKPAL